VGAEIERIESIAFFELIRIDDEEMDASSSKSDNWGKSDPLFPNADEYAESFHTRFKDQFPEDLDHLSKEVAFRIANNPSDVEKYEMSPHTWLNLILHLKLNLIRTKYNFLINFYMEYRGFDSEERAIRSLLNTYHSTLRNPQKQLSLLRTSLLGSSYYISKETSDRYSNLAIEIFTHKLKELNPQTGFNSSNNSSYSNMEKIFVLHSWIDAKPSDEALALTEFLRRSGFEAEMDVMLSDRGASINFNEMMSRAFTDYKKLIVVLSGSYKFKADTFRGGVGNEYRIILDQIQKTPEKFIFVSFESIVDDIVPTAIAGREIIDLRKDASDGYNLLFSRLNEQPIYPFSAVAPKRPEITKKEIPSIDDVIQQQIPREEVQNSKEEKPGINAHDGQAFLFGLSNSSTAKLDEIEKGFSFKVDPPENVIFPHEIRTEFIQTGIFFFAFFPIGRVQLPVDLGTKMLVPNTEEIFEFPSETIFQFGQYDIDNDGVPEIIIGAFGGIDRLVVNILKFHPPGLESGQLRQNNWELLRAFEGRYEGRFQEQSITFPMGNSGGFYNEWTWTRGKFVDTGEY
jgi:hypothetical protein